MVLVILLLAACDVAQPGLPQTDPASQPTLAAAPTATRVDILPQTGAELATPGPRYDPLMATLVGSPTQPGDQPAAGAAGAAGAATPEPTATLPAEQPTVIPPTNAPAQALNTPDPAISPIATGKLHAPVLGLMPSRQGLWAMRADGTQATLLTGDPVAQLATSPGGTMAAYLTNINGAVAFDQPFGYELKIMALFNDQVYTITGLTPPGLSDKSQGPALDSAFQTLVAYGRGGLAWSPDGVRLAFVSGHEGDPNQPAPGDVYLYTPSLGKLERISKLNLPTGPAHAFGLAWSRDGAHLYYSAAYSFGQSASDIAGAWVYALNGETVQVAPERQSTGETLQAWLPSAQVLISSRGPCGDSNLRMVDYRTGDSQVVWPSCYADLLYSRLGNEAVISLTPDLVDPNSGLSEGVYQVSLSAQQPSPRQITHTSYLKLYQGDYRAAWYGFNPTQGLIGIQRNGTLLPTFTGPPFDGSNGDAPEPVGRLPDNVTWLWSGQGGLFTARPGSQPKPVVNLTASHLISSPTRVGLYFFFAPDPSGQTRLYSVSARDWQPVEVDPRIVNPSDLVWVP